MTRKRIAFRRFTDTTIVSAADLRKEELTIIRSSGASCDREEYEDGIRGAAAPVVDARSGRIVGVSVTGPADRTTGQTLREWGHLVRSAATAIQRDLVTKMEPKR